MRAIFRSYIDKRFRYVFLNGPDAVTTRTQALSEGLNCITLVHLLLKDLFDVSLPANLKGWEMFCDNPYMDNVDSLTEMKMGDVVFFGRRELPDYAIAFSPSYDENGNMRNEKEGNAIIQNRYVGVHLTMYTGQKDIQGCPIFIHANKIDNTISIWSLVQFMANEKYTTVHGIKRAKK